MIGFGEELHDAVFDAVVDHFDEMAAGFFSDIGHAPAGFVIFCGDFFEIFFDFFVGGFFATGHHARAF